MTTTTHSGPVQLANGRCLRASAVLALVLAAATGCDEIEAGFARRVEAARADSVATDSMARARQDSINRAQPGYVVDSILPIEEELRRFRVGLGAAPSHLVGGASSRETLIRRFAD
ncbi:MAG TPA: hypothetical protein VFM38_04450, partial [Candidatus Limnocylindrales bacterium]|nr:hypothetical protein [Candidatus Limnocylindrales bacterium]